jgi:hypothetical protein
MTQLSLTAAAAARADALRRVEEHADPGWNERAFAALSAYLRTHPSFFCDDLWSAGLDRPHDSRALGPVIVRASKAKLMVQTGEYRKSVASNLSIKPVWKSLVFVGSCGGSGGRT